MTVRAAGIARPGDVVILEADTTSPKELAAILKAADTVYAESGVRFVVLHAGTHITSEPTP